MYRNIIIIFLVIGLVIALIFLIASFKGEKYQNSTSTITPLQFSGRVSGKTFASNNPIWGWNVIQVKTMSNDPLFRTITKIIFDQRIPLAPFLPGGPDQNKSYLQITGAPFINGGNCEGAPGGVCYPGYTVPPPAAYEYIDGKLKLAYPTSILEPNVGYNYAVWINAVWHYASVNLGWKEADSLDTTWFATNVNMNENVMIVIANLYAQIQMYNGFITVDMLEDILSGVTPFMTWTQFILKIKQVIHTAYPQIKQQSPNPENSLTSIAILLARMFQVSRALARSEGVDASAGLKGKNKAINNLVFLSGAAYGAVQILTGKKQKAKSAGQCTYEEPTYSMYELEQDLYNRLLTANVSNSKNWAQFFRTFPNLPKPPPPPSCNGLAWFNCAAGTIDGIWNGIVVNSVNEIKTVWDDAFLRKESWFKVLWGVVNLVAVAGISVTCINCIPTIDAGFAANELFIGATDINALGIPEITDTGSGVPLDFQSRGNRTRWKSGADRLFFPKKPKPKAKSPSNIVQLDMIEGSEWITQNIAVQTSPGNNKVIRIMASPDMTHIIYLLAVQGVPYGPDIPTGTYIWQGSGKNELNTAQNALNKILGKETPMYYLSNLDSLYESALEFMKFMYEEKFSIEKLYTVINDNISNVYTWKSGEEIPSDDIQLYSWFMYRYQTYPANTTRSDFPKILQKYIELRLKARLPLNSKVNLSQYINNVSKIAQENNAKLKRYGTQYGNNEIDINTPVTEMYIFQSNFDTKPGTINLTGPQLNVKQTDDILATYKNEQLKKMGKTYYYCKGDSTIKSCQHCDTGWKGPYTESKCKEYTKGKECVSWNDPCQCIHVANDNTGVDFRKV